MIKFPGSCNNARGKEKPGLKFLKFRTKTWKASVLNYGLAVGSWQLIVKPHLVTFYNFFFTIRSS